ncbi:GFA family protein [Seohaeicola nanhaiensis]|uniref:GFA family protein n=1 Tax=Seohaeicola nanhaiensis TaxID=1387282 RepID=A0ABV9KH51_9RHOB
MYKGSCNCGGVTFTVAGDLAPPSACHCGQCRKQSGHFWASARAENDVLTVNDAGSLRWYAASDFAKRGFCGTCGAFLFWKNPDESHTSVALGALEKPTGLALSRHIFVADKGDYYDLNDDLPKRAQ